MGKTAKEVEDEKIARGVRARRRFRALVLLTMLNKFWLEDVEVDDQLGGDVKKNVALLMRKKEKKGLLTKHDKIILNKPKQFRTEEEKEYLHKIIGGLTCFRKYPPTVKKELAASTYFLYYPANKIIVKQNRPGLALYFILTGEVAVSITIFDPIKNEMVTNVVGTMVAGQMFGEVSLLHDIPRTATITTTTDVELLCLMKDDFNVILKSTLQAIWDKILYAITRFNYFDFFDEIAKRECCIYSKIKHYKKGEIIIGHKVKSGHNVYFILKGRCQLIQCLSIVKIKQCGKTTYRLFDKDKYLEEQAKLEDERRKISKDHLIKLTSKRSEIYNIKNVSVFKLKEARKSFREASELELTEEKKGMVVMQEPESLIHVDHDFKEPSFVSKVFMQVAVYNELACFGIGENMKDRSVLAITDVECLVIPKYWLMARNVGNVWRKVMQCLNTKLPNTEEVFNIFVQNRQWGAYNRRLVNTLVNKPPINTTNNIPFSYRLEKDIDYGVIYEKKVR